MGALLRTSSGAKHTGAEWTAWWGGGAARSYESHPLPGCKLHKPEIEARVAAYLAAPEVRHLDIIFWGAFRAHFAAAYHHRVHHMPCSIIWDPLPRILRLYATVHTPCAVLLWSTWGLKSFWRSHADRVLLFLSFSDRCLESDAVPRLGLQASPRKHELYLALHRDQVHLSSRRRSWKTHNGLSGTYDEATAGATAAAVVAAVLEGGRQVAAAAAAAALH